MSPPDARAFDRAAERRRDAAWLAAALADPETQVVPVWGTRNLVELRGEPRAVLVTGAAAVDLAAAGPPIFLGLAGARAYFAVPLDDAGAAVIRGHVDGAGTEVDWVELRTVAARLRPDDASLLAYARALAWWHGRTGYCGVCGSPTASRDGGHVRACLNAACGTSHFPRTDPAVIMLITHGDACLLGRQATWADGLYSTLAGFVEPGERLEDAVRRETREEAGVVVGAVRYHSSQPWPFPASLMLAFVGEALSRDVRVDEAELADARWFTRAELLDGVADGSLRLPGEFSVARRLIAEWMAG